MSNKNFFSLIVVFFLGIGVTYSQILEDRVFSEHIHSVRLFPQGAQQDSQLDAPVVSLSDSRQLVLLFDDIAYDPEQYSAKLIHCDADWKQSALRNNDFSVNFNEFNIQEYSYSVNTRIPYIHYAFTIPRVTKSGNYVVKVYRNRDEKEVILTRRFMVYEELFTVGASIVPPTQSEERRALQQVNVAVNYSKVDLIDPTTQVKVVIRQNQRWDNAKFLAKPTFLNQSSKSIRYEPFDGSNTFRAGNEFRFVDLRFIRATGVNIAEVKVEETVILANTLVDRPRPGGTYSQYLDLNGQYIVFTNDRPGGDPEVESEYIYTTFYLQADPGRDIVMLGALTAWGKSPESKMVYDPKSGLYSTSILTKQGWYDYQFGFPTANGYESDPIEGSFFETENEYEVLVYYRALGSRYDQLVGYVYLHPNRRRI
ncbi:type IX secretion system plug protein [Algoriphagus boritolerans]|uniref:Type 9 secretion system plug protein N-terminal domain-containing protein n=1 Tax=Algoriphagus boritolerans DSM 17298 = JCM 18970 TaxID=1120964 RepID=A0A1H5X003_9BACT|nr:DUF5103 domain-containing protein [Algoriphagus boritolerans]SEG04586.1 protein of unknown function [Algoriphagus boritolerans DSM 17298 = JCM 18970]